MTTIEFRNGDRMPLLGLGTWKAEPGEVGAAVTEAVRQGYRHIDCAPIYGNEPEVGEALARCFADGLVTREELWITSKLWNDSHATEEVVPALRRTLADLRLDCLDLYLVHWPVALRRGVTFPEGPDDLLSLEERPIRATWAGMEAAVDAGLARHIGVSNFSQRKLADLCEAARIAPEANQVELHPYLQQDGLVAFCRERGIVPTAYSPLGSKDRPEGMRAADEPVLLEDPVIREIAERRGATPAQVLLAWGLARGTAVLAKSVRAEHLEQNLAAAEVVLSDSDLQAIAGLDRRRRYVTGEFWAMPGSPYSLPNLWDE